jgi:hypothetical protein
MISRLISITLLGILIIGGLIAAFYSQAIERTLTAPLRQSMSSHAMGMLPEMPTASPTAPVPPATPTQAAQVLQASILAQDTFQRADEALWGVASDGQSWQGDANKLAAFSIGGSIHTWGQIANNQGQGEQIYNALLGPASENVNLVVRGSVNLFSPNVNFGVVLRWQDVNNWYKVLIDGSDLVVLKRVNGVTTRLGASRFTALGGKTYTLHFRAIGATLFASAWPGDQPEPAHWMIVVSDMSLVSGQGGVRVVLQNNTVIHVASFLETAANSGM